MNNSELHVHYTHKLVTCLEKSCQVNVKRNEGSAGTGQKQAKIQYPRYNLSYHAVGLLASEQLNEGFHLAHFSKFFMEV